MRFLNVLLGAATAATVLAAPAGQSAVQKRKSKFQFTGVSESGGEFGEAHVPGQLDKDYVWPAHASIDVRPARKPPSPALPPLTTDYRPWWPRA